MCTLVCMVHVCFSVGFGVSNPCVFRCVYDAGISFSVCVAVCMFWHESVCQYICNFHAHAKHKLQANNQKVVVLGSKLKQKQVASAILWSWHI